MKVFVLLAVLCLAIPVQARSGNEPLPPSFVTATWTQAGVEVSWLPPVQEGAEHPILEYRIERFDPDATIPTWTQIGSVAANGTAFVDATTPTGLNATYRVTSINNAGPSFPSNPSAPMAMSGGGGDDDDTPIGQIKFVLLDGPCGLIHLGSQPDIDWDCVWGLLNP
ncbi:MAG: fibronectin type III domain-containing protein [Candidatus Thermoplasmatota archaeon]|jgi:hypothetical protein